MDIGHKKAMKRIEVIISSIFNSISTCCVYTPVNLGPSFEMDLQKVNAVHILGFTTSMVAIRLILRNGTME